MSSIKLNENQQQSDEVVIDPADRQAFIDAIDTGNATMLGNLIVKNWHLVKLVKIGARGNPPLLYACRAAKPNKQIIQSLIEVGADLDAENLAGNFALLAVRDVELVHLLVSKGANVRKVRASTGYNIFTKSMAKQRLPILLYLLAKKYFGANETIKQEHVLASAIQMKNLDMVKLFVQYGAQVNNRFGGDGHTSVHAAVASQDMAIIKYIIEDCKGDVHIATRSNMTALTIAITLNNVELVKYLVESAGAQLNEDLVLNQVLACTRIAQNAEMASYLIKRFNPSFACVNVLEQQQKLLEQQQQQQQQEQKTGANQGNPLLQQPLIKPNMFIPSVAFAGIQHIHPESNINSVGPISQMDIARYETVTEILQQVVKLNNLDLLKNILQRGANINSISITTNESILDTALLLGNLQVIQFLLLMNAKTNLAEHDDKVAAKVPKATQEFLMRVARVDAHMVQHESVPHVTTGTIFTITCWNFEMFITMLKTKCKLKVSDKIRAEYLDAETQGYKELNMMVLRAFNNNDITIRIVKL